MFDGPMKVIGRDAILMFVFTLGALFFGKPQWAQTFLIGSIICSVSGCIVLSIKIATDKIVSSINRMNRCQE